MRVIFIRHGESTGNAGVPCHDLGAIDVEFTKDELVRLGKASALPAEYPGWMIERQSGYRTEG